MITPTAMRKRIERKGIGQERRAHRRHDLNQQAIPVERWDVRSKAGTVVGHVVDMSSGRTVMVNDRELGATEAFRLEKDKLQIADMDYVVRTYLDYLYRVDQRSRAKDIEAALRLMVPGQAKKFAQYLTEQKVLQTQREQQWNATWKAEYLEHAPGKPLTVKVYGTQEIDLVIKNQSKHVTKHVLLTVELLPDAPEDGTFRLDRNLRSGFRINTLDYKELSSNESDTPVVTNTPS